MIVHSNQLKEMPGRYRAELINSLSGYHLAALIGTQNLKGTSNLGVFNSVVHIGSNPPLLGFILRPLTVPRHTYHNILAQGVYSINHMHAGILDAGHQSSAKYAWGASEFEAVGLTEERIEGYSAPLIKEAQVKMILELREDIPIPTNGTRMLVGEVVYLEVPDTALVESGALDLPQLDTLAVQGSYRYHQAQLTAVKPYAKP
jgi:flavin reductase (DIM6/NTAB) family NADH-FMN oxidoreductase RutF